MPPNPPHHLQKLCTQLSAMRMHGAVVHTISRYIIFPQDPKPITALCVFDDIILAGSLDGTLSVFRAQGTDWERGYVKTANLKLHRREISEVVPHPGNNYVLTCSKDKSWALVSLEDGSVLCVNKRSAVELTACDYHPGGGVIALAGADGTVELVTLGGANSQEVGIFRSVCSSV